MKNGVWGKRLERKRGGRKAGAGDGYGETGTAKCGGAAERKFAPWSLMEQTPQELRFPERRQEKRLKYWEGEHTQIWELLMLRGARLQAAYLPEPGTLGGKRRDGKGSWPNIY